jgi:hypothetical protein
VDCIDKKKMYDFLGRLGPPLTAGKLFFGTWAAAARVLQAPSQIEKGQILHIG